MNKNAGLKFTKDELDALLIDPHSHVHLQEDVKHHMLLPPISLSDPHAAILAILNSDLMKFFPKFRGILLSYKRVRMLGTTGSIQDDTCNIHINLLVDFYIFTPTVGCLLKGIVSKRSPYSIGVLVHKGFNVAIPVPKIAPSDESSSVQIGQQIMFEVEYLDFKGKLPYIRGKLVVKDFSNSEKKKKKKKSKTNPELEQSAGESEPFSITPLPLRKRKHTHSEVQLEYQNVAPAMMGEVSSDSGLSSPTTKRKKYEFIGDKEQKQKDRKSSFETTVTDSVTVYEKKKKKHKKSKYVEDSEETSHNNEMYSLNFNTVSMEESSKHKESSRVSQTFEESRSSKKEKKRKKEKDQLSAIEDHMQGVLSPDSAVQNHAVSINYTNESSFIDDGSSPNSLNCSLKEKKGKRRSDTEGAGLHVKKSKKQL